MKTLRSCAFLLVSTAVWSGLAFAPSSTTTRASIQHQRSSSWSPTQLLGAFLVDDPTESRPKRDPSLSAVSSSMALDPTKQQDSFLESTLLPVLSAALLMTGNTVGAGSLVLPELAAGPGMGVTLWVFVGAYLMNLVSGLCIAEVAIKQHETSGQEVPSSFQEFAQVNLHSQTAAQIISSISVFVNSCVLCFDMGRAGQVATQFLGHSAAEWSFVYAGLLVATLTTQTTQRLSHVASLFVTALFCSFGGLLLPGLASLEQPLWSVLTQEGTQGLQSVSQVAPVILISMVYQNIVPSITKLLNYDRTQTVASIVLGSLIPLCMYVAWCITVLGGGVDLSTTAGPLLTVFSVAALSGSSIGSCMSLAEELDTTRGTKQTNSFSFLSVLMAISVPLAAGWMLGTEHCTSALSVAGSFGTPLLYGVIPTWLAWNQRQQQRQLSNNNNLVPLASLGVLGVASTGFVGQEIVTEASNLLQALPV